MAFYIDKTVYSGQGDFEGDFPAGERSCVPYDIGAKRLWKNHLS